MAFAASRIRSVAARRKAPTRSWERGLTALAAIFLGGGILSSLAGFALIVIRAVIPDSTTAGDAGTILIFCTIPLLLAGSHVMDLIDKRARAARKEQAETQNKVYDWDKYSR